MARDSYKGTPKLIPALVDKDGNIVKNHPNVQTAGTGAFKPFITGSGVLVDGIATISDTSIGWHTTVLLTVASGSTTSGVNYLVDPANQLVYVNGGPVDDRRFNYMLVNPGLGAPKVS